MSKSLEELTDEILGRIKEELPEREASNSLEEAFTRVLETVTPKGKDSSKVKDKMEDKGGWHIP